jgi:hypothetical protein
MQRMTVAIHEAGHAVACVCLGVDFSYVTCNYDGKCSGHVRLDLAPEYASAEESKDGAEARLFWEHYLITTLAGPAAHKKRHPRAHWGTYKWDDLGACSDIVNDLFADRDVRNAYIKYIEARAKEFIERHRDDIGAVARELAEQGTLTDNQVRAVMLRHADTCPPWLTAA